MSGCGCGKITPANTVTPEQLQAAADLRAAQEAALVEQQADSQVNAIANAGGGELVRTQ